MLPCSVQVLTAVQLGNGANFYFAKFNVGIHVLLNCKCHLRFPLL